jgi:hypothetical protein
MLTAYDVLFTPPSSQGACWRRPAGRPSDSVTALIPCSRPCTVAAGIGPASAKPTGWPPGGPLLQVSRSTPSASSYADVTSATSSANQGGQRDRQPLGGALQARQVEVQEGRPTGRDAQRLEDRLAAGDAEVVGAQDRRLRVGQPRRVPEEREDGSSHRAEATVRAWGRRGRSSRTGRTSCARAATG